MSPSENSKDEKSSRIPESTSGTKVSGNTGTRLFDIQVSVVHVFAFLSIVLVHEAGIVWWGSSVSSQISEIKRNMIDGDDVRVILDREAPWYQDKEQIGENKKRLEIFDQRMRELEKVTTRITVQLETILERLPAK